MRRNLEDSFYVNLSSMNDEVTGSCHHLTVKYPDGRSERLLVDCGIYQEPKYKQLNSELLFNPENIDAILVTHGHIDHIGKLPYVVKKGFDGPIYSTSDTKRIMPFALYDTHQIEKREAKANHRSPLYSDKDVSDALHLVVGKPYNETFDISENIKCTFFYNAHLVGASMILLQISYYGCEDINLLFTGDYNVGNIFFDVPEIPKWITELPINIICESTYGDMESSEIHYDFKKNILNFLKKQRLKKKTATIIIPAPSLQRSQHVLKILKEMQDCGELSKNIPIYFDGKLSRNYTNLFLSGLDTVQDMDFIPSKFHFVDEKQLRRKILAQERKTKIIVTSSGMASHGPAKAYLQHYIGNPDALIHFVCYLAEDTLGRHIMDHKKFKQMEIGGMIVKKQAAVSQTNEFSSHAKSDELLDLLKKFKNVHTIFVGHGPKEVKSSFAELIVDEIPNCKNVCILSRSYFYRIRNYKGPTKKSIVTKVDSLTTHFKKI